MFSEQQIERAIADGFERIEIVHTGKYLTKPPKPETGFTFKILDGSMKGEAISFILPKKSRASIGSVYDAFYNPTTGSARLFGDDGRLNFKRRHTDTNAIAEWQLQEQAEEIRKRIAKAERDAEQHNTIIEVLAPIIALYNKTDRIGKLAIETQVLAALRTGERWRDYYKI